MSCSKIFFYKNTLCLFFSFLERKRSLSRFCKEVKTKLSSSDSLRCFLSQLVKLFLDLNRNLFFFKKKLRTKSLKSCGGKRKDICTGYYTFSLLSARCFLLILLYGSSACSDTLINSITRHAYCRVVLSFFTLSCSKHKT